MVAEMRTHQFMDTDDEIVELVERVSTRTLVLALAARASGTSRHTVEGFAADTIVQLATRAVKEERDTR